MPIYFELGLLIKTIVSHMKDIGVKDLQGIEVFREVPEDQLQWRHNDPARRTAHRHAHRLFGPH